LVLKDNTERRTLKKRIWREEKNGNIFRN